MFFSVILARELTVCPWKSLKVMGCHWGVLGGDCAVTVGKIHLKKAFYPAVDCSNATQSQARCKSLLRKHK